MPRDVRVDVGGGLSLPGYLEVPDGGGGVVLFAHGSGSSRDSPRNQHVARILNDAGFATLLFDLLRSDEAGDRANVFDIGLLGQRLLDAARWVDQEADTSGLPIGLFGASTGAAAALTAAADLPDKVGAVVSRGGRPDLAEHRLAEVITPTLLIVGGLDTGVIGLNEEAAQRLRGEHEVVIVEGASHLFEEPGKLDEVAEHAVRWFDKHLAGSRG